MRILTIIDILNMGGRARAAQEYTLGYQRAGCDVAVLSIHSGGVREDVLHEYDVPVFIGGPDSEAQQVAAHRAAEWQPEVIHLHSRGPVRPFVAEAVEALKGKLTTRAPILETTSFGKVDYQQRFTGTDVHLLMTRWALWKWQQWTRPIRPKPIGTVVPITVDPDAFYRCTPEEQATFREQYGIPDNAIVFGRIGQCSPWKWSPVIFEAFESVALRHPSAYLLLVGLPDALKPCVDALPDEVRARVKELPLLHGDDALRTCYSALDVLLHAARIGESFGLVLVEAMLCECPVITLSTPDRDNSQLEVVGHERGGLAVSDTASMIAAMERLLEDTLLRQRFGRDGAAFVRAHYTLDQAIPALLRIAQLACEAPNRDVLAAALRAEATLTTEVTDTEIHHLLDNTMGEVPFSKRMLMRLVHTPALVRPLWALKKLRDQGRDGPRPQTASLQHDNVQR